MDSEVFKLTLKFSFLLIIASISLYPIYAQTGPGGVGSSATNSLWLRANDIGQGDATAVSNWSDFSGNSNDASQGNPSYQPIYETNEINGYSVVRFDGVDDYFDDARSYNARTVFVIYRELSANQATSDLAQVWGNYAEGVHVALDARNTPGTWSFDANGSNTGRLGLNGAAYGGFAANPGSPNWSYDQFELVTAEFNATRSITRQIIGSLFPSFAVGTHQFGGDIAEIIVYNTTLNTAQRIIVENYLAAKYSLSISNDFYSYQITHGSDVAGIGRTSAGNEHTSAMSANILRIENSSSLDDADYLLFGHDSGDVSSWTATESPDGGVNIDRLGREWILSETGDVGTIDLIVDVASLPAQLGGHNMYALLVDSDGDFSSGASVYELVNSSGSEYAISGVDVSDGQYIAIASMNAVIEHSTATSSGNEASNAIISVETNFIPQNDVTVEYTTADGTATTAQPDYTGETSTVLTITAPSTTDNYTISINNDVALEADETFTITLANPSVGSIGSIATHTYTIQDDDNPRKIYFDLSTSSNSENVTAGNIAVSINLVDNSNPTTVDYAVTGGTAVGGGTDFTLAAGTLTINSTTTTNNIPFTVNNESLFEQDETFVVTLSSPTNCNLDNTLPYGGTGFVSHTYTINNDDTAPVIQFNATSSSGDEGTTPVTFQVDLSLISGADASVNYTVTGTATGGGTDYLLADGVLTITAGNTTEDIVASIIDDGIEEFSETVIITLSGPSNATLGTNTVHTFTILDNDNSGNAGPGGVGKTSNLNLWLDGDIIAQADLSSVSSWSDISGNNHNATQGLVADQPIYRTGIVNGHSVVRFDGSSDYLSDAHSYTGRTVFVVYQMLTANQDVNDLAQVWGKYNDGAQVGIDARNVPGTWSFDGNDNTTARVSLNGGAFGAFGENPTSPNWSYDVFEIATVEFSSAQAVSSQDIGALIDVAGHYLGGDIAELFVYDFAVKDAQRIIIDNYLAAKFGLSLSANDIYSQDDPGNGDYDYEVAGIGRVDISNFHVDSQGSGIVRVIASSGLDDDEFYFWGHDNGSTFGNEGSDVPASVEARMERIWRGNEVDASGIAVDVGAIDIQFDLTGLGPVTASDLRLLVDTDNDGLFNDETPIGSASSVGGDIYQFSGVTAIEDNFRFTIGTINASQTPLPIELLSFTATANDKLQVELEWQTASETNNQYFTVERAMDGTNWMILDSLAGAGDSDEIIKYHYLDQQPLFGSNYYRIKQTDFDGEFTYSPLRLVHLDNKGNLSVYPNPTGNSVILKGLSDGFESIKVYDLQGQNFSDQVLFIDSSEGFVIDFSPLSPGQYFIETKEGSLRIIKR